jgi:hypothetical protein
VAAVVGNTRITIFSFFIRKKLDHDKETRTRTKRLQPNCLKVTCTCSQGHTHVAAQNTGKHLLSRWRKLHASWMGDSWTKLDGDIVEKEVMTVFKVMSKTAKVLTSRELPACSENCLSIKEEVNTPLSTP